MVDGSGRQVIFKAGVFLSAKRKEIQRYTEPVGGGYGRCEVFGAGDEIRAETLPGVIVGLDPVVCVRGIPGEHTRPRVFSPAPPPEIFHGSAALPVTLKTGMNLHRRPQGTEKEPIRRFCRFTHRVTSWKATFRCK